MLPRVTVEAFDAWLKSRALRLDAIVIGGSALALLGVTDRQTRDFDILHPELPDGVVRAAREFAARMRAQGIDLSDDWLNNGPSQLTEVLPRDWSLRLRSVYEGVSLRLRTLGRLDLLCTKLFALCDRGTDFSDCLALAPAESELEKAELWLRTQDVNPMWPEHVRSTIDDLRKRLGYGL